MPFLDLNQHFFETLKNIEESVAVFRGVQQGYGLGLALKNIKIRKQTKYKLTRPKSLPEIYSFIFFTFKITEIRHLQHIEEQREGLEASESLDESFMEDILLNEEHVKGGEVIIIIIKFI